ncbi:MAG: hypothetical protein ABWY45_06040 [Mycobacterium sp.]
MRPILLGCAAAALFIGGVMMAPLTSDLAVSICPVGTIGDSGLSCSPAPVGAAPETMDAGVFSR